MTAPKMSFHAYAVLHQLRDYNLPDQEIINLAARDYLVVEGYVKRSRQFGPKHDWAGLMCNELTEAGNRLVFHVSDDVGHA